MKHHIETLYSDKDLYQLVEKAGEFILAHNYKRLERFRSWIKEMIALQSPIRKIDHDDDFDLEIFFNQKWQSLNRMFDKVFEGEVE